MDGEQEMNCPKCGSNDTDSLEWKKVKNPKYYCYDCGNVWIEEVK